MDYLAYSELRLIKLYFALFIAALNTSWLMRTSISESTLLSPISTHMGSWPDSSQSILHTLEESPPRRRGKGQCCVFFAPHHYSDVILSVIASQIIGVSIICPTVCSSADQRKHWSSASLAFDRGIHRWAVDSPHKRPVTWKMFPFHDVIIFWMAPVCKCIHLYNPRNI